ncbi:hypothetical protein BDY19DRAFT_964195, partial [Irpex rosettiformis]
MRRNFQTGKDPFDDFLSLLSRGEDSEYWRAPPGWKKLGVFVYSVLEPQTRALTRLRSPCYGSPV